MASPNTKEAFPAVDENINAPSQSPISNGVDNSATNRPTASSSLSSHLRRASKTFEQSDLPEGFFAASGGIASSLLAGRTITRSTVASNDGAPTRANTIGRLSEGSISDPSTRDKPEEPVEAAAFPNGYHFPPKHSFGQSTKTGFIAFWHYATTPVGFFVTLYGLNIVAWGGMLFLLLCNASPAMCHPTCNDINSPRRKWIEWDSQILNALFCVTGFGLAPWRFRDLYFLLKYRIWAKEESLRKLAGIHRGWFRLRGSQELPVNLGPGNVAERQNLTESSMIPIPESKIPDAPLTGVRARASRIWIMDLVIWLMVSNTFLQCVLCGFMWGMNRYNRPSWATGTFVALGCIVAGIGGILMFIEGKAVKAVEGVPISKEDLELLARDRERGIFHYNNMKDESPEAKEKKGKD